MQILEDINRNAESVEDMQTDLAKEIYATSIEIRHRIVQIITAKSNLCIDFNSVPSYL
jgi:hypothetical protein